MRFLSTVQSFQYFSVPYMFPLRTPAHNPSFYKALLQSFRENKVFCRFRLTCNINTGRKKKRAAYKMWVPSLFYSSVPCAQREVYACFQQLSLD